MTRRLSAIGDRLRDATDMVQSRKKGTGGGLKIMSGQRCSAAARAASFLGVVGILAGCGGGGGMGQMSLAVADAPIDGAQAVVVKFTGVELTANAGNPTTIIFDQPKSIDLLNQSGMASAVLFNEPIRAGSYGQIRLLVVADGDPSNSYITLSDGTMRGLQVPSGSQTGLKLVSGFTVPSAGVVDYTIDFDLRKAVVCPPGQSPVCFLKPAERLVENTSVGNIQGVVDSSLVPVGCMPGVYLYSGVVSAPEDMDSTAPAMDANQPIASKMPVANSQPSYYYQFSFLEPGTFTLAFTCQADQDNPDQPDSAVTFSPVNTGITVTASETTTADLP
jgi:hypothetical protein